jgi:transposase, IS5 family
VRQARPEGLQPLHAAQVENIGKARRQQLCEFGVKVSLATMLKRCTGGQFAIHAHARPAIPYDGHRLAQIIPPIEGLRSQCRPAIRAWPACKGGQHKDVDAR